MSENKTIINKGCLNKMIDKALNKKLALLVNELKGESGVCHAFAVPSAAVNIRQTKKYCFMEEGYIYVDAFEEIVERLRKECLGDCYIPYNSITENIPVKRSIRRGNEYPAYDYNALKKRFQDTIKCLQTVLGEMERINAEDKVGTEYYKVIEVVEFGKTKDIEQVKQAVSKEGFAKFEPPVTNVVSITEDEFLYLNKRFSSKRRHDTCTE